MAPTNSRSLFVWLPLVMAFLAIPLSAQASYRDFTIVRNREQPFKSLFQVRAGYRGVDAEGENLETGLTDDTAFDGYILFHSKDVAEGEDLALDFYSGLDGTYLGLKNQLFPGRGDTQSRLEFFGRSKAFFREGYYVGGDYLTTGQYEGEDYGTRISTASSLAPGMILDIGVFYRSSDFSRNSQTRPDFMIPDQFDTYGLDFILEQNTVLLSRDLGLPESGLLVSLLVQYEENDSSRMLGGTNSYLSALPSTLWRGDLHAEIYRSASESTVWEIIADGGYYDSSDRVASYHAEHVQGYIWGDATLGLRMNAGDSFVIKPFAQAQFSKILELDGVGSDEKLFWGGGLESSLIFTESMALVMSYSYVDNPSRGHAGLGDDLYGEHQFFVGLDVSFGSGYRVR